MDPLTRAAGAAGKHAPYLDWPLRRSAVLKEFTVAGKISVAAVRTFCALPLVAVAVSCRGYTIWHRTGGDAGRVQSAAFSAKW
jgi:hypothetical protein